MSEVFTHRTKQVLHVLERKSNMNIIVMVFFFISQILVKTALRRQQQRLDSVESDSAENTGALSLAGSVTNCT